MEKQAQDIRREHDKLNSQRQWYTQKLKKLQDDLKAWQNSQFLAVSSLYCLGNCIVVIFPGENASLGECAPCRGSIMANLCIFLLAE